MTEEQDKYTYETHGIGGVYMEERFYSYDELRKLLSTEEILAKHLRKAISAVKKANEK